MATRAPRILMIGLAVSAVGFAASAANACDVTIGDWKVARGDIASAKRIEKTGEKLPDLLIGAFDIQIIFSNLAGKDFRKVTEKYLNKKMPIIIENYENAPMIHEPINSGQTIISAPSEIQANEILRNLRDCI
jgi:hypothetical protein